MVTNIGFDADGLPFVEVGADEGEIQFVGDRPLVSRSAARSVAFTLERSVDGGTTWESVLAETISGDGANLTDYESLSYGDTLYRAVAFSAEGATAETTVTVAARSAALWLSGGPAFGLTCRLPFDPQKRINTKRERALKAYAGRSRPVAVTGEMTTRTVSVSGSTNDLDGDTAPAEKLSDLSLVGDRLFLFRDPDGRRIYGQIDAMDLSWQQSDLHDDGYNSWWGYGFTLTEAT